LTCNIVVGLLVGDAIKQKNPAHRRIGRGTFETRSSASTSVVRAKWPFVPSWHARAFNRTDVKKDVIAAVGRLNGTKAVLVAKPLLNSRMHGDVLSQTAYT
jgi:hypothetical protein